MEKTEEIEIKGIGLFLEYPFVTWGVYLDLFSQRLWGNYVQLVSNVCLRSRHCL